MSIFIACRCFLWQLYSTQVAPWQYNSMQVALWNFSVHRWLLGHKNKNLIVSHCYCIVRDGSPLNILLHDSQLSFVYLQLCHGGCLLWSLSPMLYNNIYNLNATILVDSVVTLNWRLYTVFKLWYLCIQIHALVFSP